MKVSTILREHVGSIIINVLAMLVSSLFLISVGTAGGIILIILPVWLAVLLIYYGVSIHQTHKHLASLMTLADNLNERYLLAEIMNKPDSGVEIVYYQLLKMAGKSMMEQVKAARRSSMDYREYIEQWIHDVKTPISGIQLLCSNNKSEVPRTLLVELEKVEHLVEQALFYARSEETAKDYIIREFPVSEIIHTAIMENKQMLLNYHIRIEYEENGTSISTDKKWTGFILNQLIINAIQYRNEHDPVIRFEVSDLPDGTALTLYDNGIGIHQSDLPRVFDKGFTGANGRVLQKSTGFGLYLCRRLCERLGILLTIQSESGHYTRVTLFFPCGSFSKI